MTVRKAREAISLTRLIESKEGPGFFATARFDQAEGERFHYQSLAATIGLSPLIRSTYVALLGTDMQLCGRDAPSEEQMRRMVFNVLASNRDDHTRNHAFLMGSDGRWAPAPAFDVTYNKHLEHELMIGRDPTNLGADDLRDVVNQLGGDTVILDAIIKEIRDVVRAWPEFAREAGLDAVTTDAIRCDLKTVAP